MSEMTDEELVEVLVNLPVSRFLKIRQQLSERLGIDLGVDTSPVPVYGGVPFYGAPAYGCPFPEREQTEFDVVLESFAPEHKVSVIKSIRSIHTNMSIADAKHLAESAPAIISSGISKYEAEDIKHKMENIIGVGAKVSIK